MATLNPQSLVTLWQIEQYGSFSATAKATGWSQPAISQQIKKLEAQCGSTLVQRTSHGVELTATGSMLARHGEAIADRLERRPVKSRIIGIIGLITCIWWPHRQSALLSRPVPWSSSVCSRTSS